MTFVKKPLAAGATLGDRLRVLREEARLSVEDLGKKINVNPKYLTAIEESRYSDLPGLVYARPFVRRYAEILETDVPMVMEIFEREYEVVKQAKPSKHPLLTPRVSTDFPWWRRYAKIILAGFVVALVIIYIGIQAAKNFLPPQLIVTEPSKDLSTTTLTITVTGTTDQNATVTINDQDIQTSGNGKFNETIDLHAGLNTLKISAVKKHSSARVVTRQVIVQTQAP